MSTNVGKIDRGFRLVLGAVLILVPFLTAAAIWQGTVLVAIAVVVGAVLFATAILGTCPIYRVLGLNTCKI